MRVCHNGDYNNTPTSCEGCHTEDYNQSTNPNHIELAIPTDCEMCHTTTPGWSPAEFEIHDDYYELTGGHVGVDCASCHNGDYNNTPTSCEGCHTEDYNQSTNPNHIDLAIPTDCEMCHTTTPGWSPAEFEIHDDYYELTGGHIGVDCASCHNGDYNNTPNTCNGCHLADHAQSSNPDHEDLGIPTNCEMCHTTAPGWSPAEFEVHDDYYPLTGAHATVDCESCHNGDYENTPNTCAGCHLEDFNATTNPDHVELGISTDCEMCHTTVPGWSPAEFEVHDDYYPLTGAHTTVDCESCHNGDYENTPNTCAGCHLEDFNATTNPDHVELGISTNCEMCHTTVPGWSPAEFEVHDDYYPLTGAHATVDCESCHNGDYENTPNTCAGCHLEDFNATTNPNHVELGISTNCEMCHTTAPGWSPAEFEIHDDYYPLTGAHVTVDCESCHNGDYENTPNTCEGCHLGDFNVSTNPDHVDLGISTDCEMCHTTDPGWSPADFPIHDDYYELTGAHIGVDCASCHDGDYNNTPNTCEGCHLEDFNASINPNHVELGIPTDCAMCHTTDPGWSPANFPIHDDYYELTGAHIGVDCAQLS